jgi:hypothetical protein
MSFFGDMASQLDATASQVEGAVTSDDMAVATFITKPITTEASALGPTAQTAASAVVTAVQDAVTV